VNHSSRRTTSLLFTAALAATALVAATTPASAQELALKRDLGLSDAEVAELRAAEAEAVELEEELRDSLGSDFGGVYLDADTTEITVAVTDPAAVSRVDADDVTVDVVDFGETALNDFVASLNAIADTADPKVTGWYTDLESDAVVITTLRGGTPAAEELAERAGLDERAVRIVEEDEEPQSLAAIIGGNPYYFGNYRCSTGFSVRQGSQTGFATAGHCGSTGTRVSSPSGTVAGSYFPGRDMGWVRITSADTVTPLVNRYNGGTVTVTGSQEAATGSSVCRSGATTGWRCGTIQSKNQTVRYAEGTVTGLTRTTACAEGGDSGGPWLTGSQAQGVTSGGTGDCRSGGITFFQPINPLLSYFGLQLVTG